LALSQDPASGKKVEATAELLVRLDGLENSEFEELLRQISQGKVGGGDAPAMAEMVGALALEATSVAPSFEQIPRHSGSGRAPLSFAQERLWIIDQLQPGNIAYNVFRPIPLAAQLDLNALKRAVARLVERHEALRTVFQVEDGRPIQVILPRLDLEVAVKDLRQLTPQERQAQASLAFQADVMRPFDLARGPLLRVTVVRFGPVENLLALSIHHII